MNESTRLPDWFNSKRSSRNDFNNKSSWCSDDKSFEQKTTSSQSTAVVVVAITAVVAYAGYELNRSVREHGWEGTLRLIWEGDAYDPALRDAVDELENAEFDLRATHRIDDRLKGLEESLDTATATAIASSSAPANVAIENLWNEVWMEHSANIGSSCSNHRNNPGGDNPITVERTLAHISDHLDKIAARVDGVILSSSSTEAEKCHTNNAVLAQRVKERKKKLSRVIVSAMERCDALVASFQVLRE
mmetsp:Transcript_8152/g.20204  ORF Transcript_8152/g.20204 Transcript_8152/m.20204 type:complete len:247 (+) Transcript_8152:30-770(+)